MILERARTTFVKKATSYVRYPLPSMHTRYEWIQTSLLFYLVFPLLLRREKGNTHPDLLPSSLWVIETPSISFSIPALYKGRKGETPSSLISLSLLS